MADTQALLSPRTYCRCGALARVAKDVEWRPQDNQTLAVVWGKEVVPMVLWRLMGGCTIAAAAKARSPSLLQCCLSGMSVAESMCNRCRVSRPCPTGCAGGPDLCNGDG